MLTTWEWKTDAAEYGTLFGAAVATLAAELRTPRVMLIADCVDDAGLEESLRVSGWNVEPPRRTRRFLGVASHGSLRAWRVMAADEAPRHTAALWTAIAAHISACAVAADEHPTGFADCEALQDGRPHLVSIDRDSVTLSGESTATDRCDLERTMVSAARSAARREGGDITVIPSPR